MLPLWGLISYPVFWQKQPVIQYLNLQESTASAGSGEIFHAVISIASLFVPNAKDGIKLIQDYIESVFEDCV